MVADSKPYSEKSSWDKVFVKWFDEEIEQIDGKFTDAEIIRSAVVLGGEMLKACPWLMNDVVSDWERDHTLSKQTRNVPWRYGEALNEYMRDTAKALNLGRNQLSIVTVLCAMPHFKAYPSLVTTVYRRLLEFQYVSCRGEMKQLLLATPNSVGKPVEKKGRKRP